MCNKMQCSKSSIVETNVDADTHRRKYEVIHLMNSDDTAALDSVMKNITFGDLRHVRRASSMKPHLQWSTKQDIISPGCDGKDFWKSIIREMNQKNVEHARRDKCGSSMGTTGHKSKMRSLLDVHNDKAP